MRHIRRNLVAASMIFSVSFFLFVSALIVASGYSSFAQQNGPNNIGAGTYGPPFTTRNGHTVFGGGAAPVATSCGTGPSIVGTDTAFLLTTGSATSGVCTITPAIAYGLRPICVIQPESTTFPTFTLSVSGILAMSANVQDSTRYFIICVAQPGGL